MSRECVCGTTAELPVASRLLSQIIANLPITVRTLEVGFKLSSFSSLYISHLPLMAGRGIQHEARWARIERNSVLQSRSVPSTQWCIPSTCFRLMRPLHLPQSHSPLIVKFVRRSQHPAGLPGPGNPSFITGHIEDLGNARCGTRYNVWMKEYEKAYRLWAPFGARLFCPPARFCSAALQCRNTDSETIH